MQQRSRAQRLKDATLAGVLHLRVVVGRVTPHQQRTPLPVMLEEALRIHRPQQVVERRFGGCGIHAARRLMLMRRLLWGGRRIGYRTGRRIGYRTGRRTGRGGIFFGRPETLTILHGDKTRLQNVLGRVFFVFVSMRFLFFVLILLILLFSFSSTESRHIEHEVLLKHFAAGDLGKIRIILFSTATTSFLSTAAGFLSIAASFFFLSFFWRFFVAHHSILILFAVFFSVFVVALG
mmetsp:Transcript_3945/g.12037  ORF Transcript_3945/g.12037 Transcript_3945/m.12037 type:complete len:235 (+) Transcript_3945:1415-2119(+)